MAIHKRVSYRRRQRAKFEEKTKKKEQLAELDFKQQIQEEL